MGDSGNLELCLKFPALALIRAVGCAERPPLYRSLGFFVGGEITCRCQRVGASMARHFGLTVRGGSGTDGAGGSVVIALTRGSLPRGVVASFRGLVAMHIGTYSGTGVDRSGFSTSRARASTSSSMVVGKRGTLTKRLVRGLCESLKIHEFLKIHG